MQIKSDHLITTRLFIANEPLKYEEQILKLAEWKFLSTVCPFSLIIAKFESNKGNWETHHLSKNII